MNDYMETGITHGLRDACCCQGQDLRLSLSSLLSKVQSFWGDSRGLA